VQHLKLADGGQRKKQAVVLGAATAPQQRIGKARTVHLECNRAAALAGDADAGAVRVIARPRDLIGELREVAVAVGQIGHRKTR